VSRHLAGNHGCSRGLKKVSAVHPGYLFFALQLRL